ncbi:hypothetical protein ABZX30_23685 [Streptomyces sp. NPDC004542]|uniref:hypothetical protein n=1 Tax=Streptomyces sp. NPDC004542 TaxID=3154281 RepID=UPI0033BDA80F
MPTLTLPPAVGARLGAGALAVLTAAGATWLAAPSATAQGEAGDIRIHRVGVPYGVSKDDPVVCRFYLDAVNFDSLGSINYEITAHPPLPNSATVTGTIALGPNSGAGHTDPMGLADGQYTLTWTVGDVTPTPTPAPTPTTKAKVFRVDCHGRQDRGQAGAPGTGAGDPGNRQGQAQDPGVLGNQAGQGQQEDPGRIEDRGGDAGAVGNQDDGPRGGVHAGGGGLVDTTQAYTPLTAAAAVGLVVVCAAVYLRLIRRRAHGAA